jgi:hypothetical protein
MNKRGLQRPFLSESNNRGYFFFISFKIANKSKIMTRPITITRYYLEVKEIQIAIPKENHTKALKKELSLKGFSGFIR